MRVLTHAARLALAASAVVAGSIAVASPANAVATPAGACGSNYHEIDHHNLKYSVIHLLYNGSTDCVVTSKTAYIGTSTFVAAVVEFADQSHETVDEGNYFYYAGPVRLNAPGKCIIWGGADGGGGWSSSPSHCG